RRGLDGFRRGHIPGAVFQDLESVSGTEGGGRHPLRSAEQFRHEMRLRGVDDNTKVVVYDDTGGSTAARLWFLLAYFGHRAQAVLNGGLQAWGQQIEDEVEVFAPGNFTAREPDRASVLAFEAVRVLRGMPLIDARAGERYRGEKEPIDPKAGHIPGALNAPYSENLESDGRF